MSLGENKKTYKDLGFDRFLQKQRSTNAVMQYGQVASGDLGGTFPRPRVTGINGIAIDESDRADGYILMYDTASGTLKYVKYKTGQEYTPTNVTTDRSFDADSTSTAELADVLGTLIADLQSAGILS